MKTPPLTTPRTKKGSVALENLEDRGLRLRWSHAGKRYCLAIGLPDNKLNRTMALVKARQIEGDMATGNFDPTLKKYQLQRIKTRTQISVVALFEGFRDSKAKTLSPKTIRNEYTSTLKYLRQFFQERPIGVVTVAEAEKFTDWFRSQNLTPEVSRKRVGLIKAAWDWAIQSGLVESTPWIAMQSRIKVPPKQMPRPFTREEIGAIIQGFKTDRYYHPYTDYVEFLFGTGCRTGEACGLQWKHVSEDCSTVWIGEMLSRGERKATKTNKARTITLTPRLQQVIKSRKPATVDPAALVFTGPQGKAILDCNFRNRPWKTILTRLEIDYRKPYTTRHTLISHALDLGMNPVMVAQLTGHDVQTLYQNYAGNVSSKPMLPEL